MKFKKLFKIGYDLKKKKEGRHVIERAGDASSSRIFAKRGGMGIYNSACLVYLHPSTCHPMIPLTLSRATIDVRFCPQSKSGFRA